MIALIERHLLLFFKDKMAVFFSLMAVFVVVGLYIAFLGDMMIKPLEASFGAGARELSDNWIIAGTLGTVALTTSMSALGVMIEDRSRHIDKDFYTSPIHEIKIMSSYLISTFIITMIISIIALSIGQAYIIYYGGAWITLSALLKIFGVMILIIITCTCILLYVMAHFHSAASFSNATTIVGTLSGFLMGIYVPIGSLPKGLQNVIQCFPPSHGASLYRKIMMEDSISRIMKDYPAEAVLNFKKQFGLDFYFNGEVAGSSLSIIILVVTAIIFIILLIILMKRRHLR